MTLVFTYNIAAIGASLLIGFATGWWIWKSRRHQAGPNTEDPTSS
jgi:uncharacterized iron-regulated membrane protein